MLITLDLILYIVACLCFLLAALDVKTRINFPYLAAALLVLTLIV